MNPAMTGLSGGPLTRPMLTWASCMGLTITPRLALLA
jgi:hypothetical protein